MRSTPSSNSRLCMMPMFLMLMLLLARMVAMVAIPPASSMMSQYSANCFLMGPAEELGMELR